MTQVSEVDDKGNVLSKFTDARLSPQHLSTDKTGYITTVVEYCPKSIRHVSP